MPKGGGGGRSEEPLLSPERRGWLSLYSPGDSSPGLSPGAEQRRREERFCPRLPAPAPRPLLRLHEPTPLSETLQPTSLRVTARGAANRRSNGDNLYLGARDAGREAPLHAPRVPARAQGDPRCKGESSPCPAPLREGNAFL